MDEVERRERKGEWKKGHIGDMTCQMDYGIKWKAC
jgi:hypothetical protein